MQASTIIGVVLVFAFVTVYAEDCKHVSDCTVTGCSAGGTLVCDVEGKCTCDSGHICVDGEDFGIPCRSSHRCVDWYQAAVNHKCECADTHNLHCIDNHCKCGYPPNA